MRQICSCGRDEVELGNDLCRYCRDDFEESYQRGEEEEEVALPDEDFHLPGATWE